jgi:threonine aldolase
MEYIDLRSDTVTQPTEAMRRAMASAVVGDDVYGEDPSINHLQELAAEMMGKEAGLFVASGTMGNLAAILAHCQRGRGDRGNKSHFFSMQGICSGGIHSCQLPNQPDGTICPDELRAVVRDDDAHHLYRA